MSSLLEWLPAPAAQWVQGLTEWDLTPLREKLGTQPLAAAGVGFFAFAVLLSLLRRCCRRSAAAGSATIGGAGVRLQGAAAGGAAGAKVVAVSTPSPPSPNVEALASPRPGAEAAAVTPRKSKGHKSGAAAEADDERLVPEASEWTLVEELRQRVQRQNKADELPGGTRWYEDSDLLRFVRARPTLNESETLFNEAMSLRSSLLGKWNDANMQEGSFGSDFVAWRQGTSAIVEAPEWFKFLSRYMPQHLYGSDRCGLPIFYSSVGRTDLQGCEREVGFDALQRFAVMMNDAFLDAARTRGKGKRSIVHGGVVIVDLEGLAWRHFREAGLFKRLSAAAKVLHPERQSKCFIINAPGIFAAIWRAISSVVDPRTAARIQILSANQTLVPLFDELGAENVPDFLGGSYTGVPDPRAQRPGDALIPQGAFS